MILVSESKSNQQEADTPFERFEQVVKGLLEVPKEELDALRQQRNSDSTIVKGNKRVMRTREGEPQG